VGTAPRTDEAVSVVICSRDRPALLGDAVESVLAGEVLPGELVVVDQSHRPHPTLRPGLVGGCEVRYLQSTEIGLSRARNAGIHASRHPIVVFLDDDVLVDRTWLGNLVGDLRRSGPRAVVTGQVRPVEHDGSRGYQLSVKVDEAPAVYEGRIGRDMLFAGNMAIFRSAFDEVGLFDVRLGAGSRFPSSEDNDFGFRLLEAGYRIAYVPSAVVHHRTWRTRAGFIALSWHYGRGQGAFYAKYWRSPDGYARGRMAADARHQLTSAPRKLARGRIVPLVGGAAFLAGVGAGAIEWAATKPEPSTG
jgi:GT2 family glycosyltransferase